MLPLTTAPDRNRMLTVPSRVTCANAHNSIHTYKHTIHAHTTWTKIITLYRFIFNKMRQEKGRRTIKAKGIALYPWSHSRWLPLHWPSLVPREEQDSFPSYPATLNSLRVRHGETHYNNMSLMEWVGLFEMFSLTLLAQAFPGNIKDRCIWQLAMSMGY